MTETLLAKPKLLPGYIDCAVGESYSVKAALTKHFDLSSYTISYSESLYEYPFSNGYPDLVKLLEEKHQAPVIITNGATQGLAASFFALNKMGKVWARCQGHPYSFLGALSKIRI